MIKSVPCTRAPVTVIRAGLNVLCMIHVHGIITIAVYEAARRDRVLGRTQEGRDIYIFPTEIHIYIDLSFWLYICLLKIKRAILFISFVIFNCKIFFNASVEVSLKYFSGKIRSSFRALNALHRLHIFLQFLSDSSRLIAASGLQLNNTFTLQKRSVSL